MSQLAVSEDIDAGLLEEALLSPPTKQLDDTSLEKRKQLEQAFTLFNQVSRQLSDTYLDLERQITDLQSELTQADQERQLALEEEERISARFSELLRLIPAGVVVINGKGIVEEANAAAVELLGEPLNGQPWIRVIERSFAPQADDGYEISLKDGRRLRIDTQPLDIEPGQLVLLTDLTETRLLQDKLNHNRNLSEMGRMVASLAHQIRTPLSTALIYASHLNGPTLDDEKRTRFAGKLVARLHDLEKQLQDMLIFARGGIELAERISVNNLLLALHESVSEMVNSHRAELDIELLQEPIEIVCSRDILIGAISNLIHNALQAKPEQAQIRVDLTLQDQFVVLTVSDNGPGIDPAVMKKILEPFFTTKSNGTGLGLPVVQAVIKAHHGQMKIDSRPGAGTAISLTLPVLKQSDIQ